MTNTDAAVADLPVVDDRIVTVTVRFPAAANLCVPTASDRPAVARLPANAVPSVADTANTRVTDALPVVGVGVGVGGGGGGGAGGTAGRKSAAATVHGSAPCAASVPASSSRSPTTTAFDAPR